MAETEVVIYYGPPSWFHSELGDANSKNLMTLVLRMDDEQREHVHRVEGQEQRRPRRPRPNRVVAESSDFASLSDNSITNFARLVHRIRPKHILLNNPPTRVHDQLVHAFKATRVVKYDYPTLSVAKLAEFRSGFSRQVVGQTPVREALLAAMYPLTRGTRRKPVIVMLYGPSGVGKTETAQFINTLLGGELMRKQFSMLHSEKSTAYLFGGEHAQASLARDLLDRESGVILLDEFDKANPVFHSAFYQVFDSGEFVDLNYRVELGPTLIICTSNYHSEDEVHQALGEALASRFDALVEFHPLSSRDTTVVIEGLVDSLLAELSDEERQLIDRDDLLLTLSPLSTTSRNVRRLGKTVETVVSLTLAKSAVENLATSRASSSDGEQVLGSPGERNDLLDRSSEPAGG